METSSNNSIDKIINYSETELLKFIKDNPDFNFNNKDSQGNYFLQKIIIKNYSLVFRELLDHNTEYDIIDKDFRSIFYYIIRFNKTRILDIIIDNINKLIGLSVFNLKDNDGYYSLSYCITFNNFKMFKILYNSGKVNIFHKNKNGDSLLHLAIKNKNIEIIKFLIFKKFRLDMLNNNYETISHYFITFLPEIDLFYDLYKSDPDFYNTNLIIKEKNFGLTAIHLIMINKNNIITKINYTQKMLQMVDFYGNTPLHYLIIEKHYKLFKTLYNKYNKIINHNITNINSQTLLHLYINSQYDENILKNLIQNTNLDIQDVDGNTSIYYIIKNNINLDYLKNKLYNLFILNNSAKNAIDISHDKKQLLQYTSENFSQILMNNSKLSKSKWEDLCIKNKNCFDKIFDYLKKEKRNPPFTHDDILKKIYIENNIPVKSCQYIGNSLDILFNLIFLNNYNVDILLHPPLTKNKKLIDYFETLGINLSFKTDFINIQIYWAYNRLFMPTYLDSDKDIKNIVTNNRFTIIPLGIELENGGHANIIIIDHKYKVIERFEPNGTNPPTDFNYNPFLLDKLLKDKFSVLKYDYLSPQDYLPPIGFQMLESLEIECQVGDPNGFCAVWCVWWCYHKINNKLDISSKVLADKLIHKIKLSNYSFKNIIRNFTTQITDIRDKTLEKFKLDINKYIQGKYTSETLLELEKYIIKQL